MRAFSGFFGFVSRRGLCGLWVVAVFVAAPSGSAQDAAAKL